MLLQPVFEIPTNRLRIYCQSLCHCTLLLQAYQFVSDTTTSYISSFIIFVQQFRYLSADMEVPRHVVATLSPMLHQADPETKT
jgi:hypothetical protein